MKKGDLVLVPFPFTDLSSTKNRPALVLLANDEDVTLAFITTQTRWAKEWDLHLEPTDQNGVTRTIHQEILLWTRRIINDGGKVLSYIEQVISHSTKFTIKFRSAYDIIKD